MPRSRLIISAIVFAVLWTVGMAIWEWPLEPAHAVILVISGAVAGLLWYWLYGMWARRYFAKQQGKG